MRRCRDVGCLRKAAGGRNAAVQTYGIDLFQVGVGSKLIARIAEPCARHEENAQGQRDSTDADAWHDMALAEDQPDHEGARHDVGHVGPEREEQA